jgi:hypothetical protein
MSAQVFALKRFYPVWASGAAIGRTRFYMNTTTKPGTGFLQLYNHFSSTGHFSGIHSYFFVKKFLNIRMD